jgi:hypothetical protein
MIYEFWEISNFNMEKYESKGNDITDEDIIKI